MYSLLLKGNKGLNPCAKEVEKGHQHLQMEEEVEGRMKEGEFLQEVELGHLPLEQELPLVEEFHPLILQLWSENKILQLLINRRITTNSEITNINWYHRFE